MSFNVSHLIEDWSEPEDFNKYLFIGPGKCGSTLMIKLLTLLGVPTGYKKDVIFPEYENAFEWPCRNEKVDYYLKITGGKFPKVIKNNLLSIDLPEVVEKYNWTPKRVFVLNRATDSIVKRHFYDRFGEDWKEKANPRSVNIRTTTVKERKATLLDNLSKLDYPVTILDFPRFAEDPVYTYKKLSPIINEFNLWWPEFESVFRLFVDQKQLRGW